jgi:hypothetical protein
MRIYQARLRQLHRTLAPVMIVPVLLTLVTGSLYQVAKISDKEEELNWLLDWHKGDFGIVNLETIYPFLNALGLLTLVITGIGLWFQVRRTSRKRSEEI